MQLCDWGRAFVAGLLGSRGHRRSVWSRCAAAPLAEVQVLEPRALLTDVAVGESFVTNTGLSATQSATELQTTATAADLVFGSAPSDSLWAGVQLDGGSSLAVADAGTVVTAGDGDLYSWSADFGGGDLGGETGEGADGNAVGETADEGSWQPVLVDWGVDFGGDDSGTDGDLQLPDWGIDDGGGDSSLNPGGELGDITGGEPDPVDWGVDFGGEDWGIDAGTDGPGIFEDPVIIAVADDGGGLGGDIGGDIGGDTGGDTGGATETPPFVRLTTLDDVAWEGPYRESGADLAQIQVLREGSQAVTVQLQLGGSAAYLSDYVILLPGGLPVPMDEQGRLHVTVPEGHQSSYLFIRTLMDGDYEEPETVEVAIAPSRDYRRGDAPASRIVLYDLTGNLRIGMSIGNRGFLDEYTEDDPGSVLRVNDDRDSSESKADMQFNHDGILRRLTLDDDELVNLEVLPLLQKQNDFVPEQRVRWSLSYPMELIRIWWIEKGAIPGDEVLRVVESGELLSRVPDRLLIEGIHDGEGIISLQWVTDEGRQQHVVDGVAFSVWNVDLDIDSDNNNEQARPDQSEWEEELENNPYGLGKLIYPVRDGSDPFTPLLVNRNPVDWPSSKVSFSLDFNQHGKSGEIRIWTVPHNYAGERIATDVEDGGHLITPGRKYSTQSIRDTGRLKGFWIEAVHADSGPNKKLGVDANGKPLDRITLIQYVLINGSLDPVGSDTVQYMVVNRDSFYPNLQWSLRETTGVVLRDVLAANAVYTPDVDLPKYALKNMTHAELTKLGLPDALIRAIRGSTVPGFQACIYRDYVSGDYILAFAGTDDPADILDNLWQGLGKYSPQYYEAMRIAAEVVDARKELRLSFSMRTTGHSLGGGLASAAAIAAGFKANTFNAAGLHPGTIYQRKPDGKSPYELYPGIGQRQLRAYEYITAWYMEYDLLSFLQDNLPAVPGVGSMPAAIGKRMKMIGPFNPNLSADAERLRIYWQEIRDTAEQYSSWRAWLAALAAGRSGAYGVHFSSIALRMLAHHETDYCYYGLMVTRPERDAEPTWDILGDPKVK